MSRDAAINVEHICQGLLTFTSIVDLERHMKVYSLWLGQCMFWCIWKQNTNGNLNSDTVSQYATIKDVTTSKYFKTWLITGTRRCNHIKPVLHQLHWLPVRCSIKFKVVCPVHQSLSGQAPVYLADDSRLVSETGRRALRTADVMTCTVQWTQKSYADRNKQFQWQLKTLLFRQWEHGTLWQFDM